MQCNICHKDRNEENLIRCPLCHQNACEDCRYRRQGRYFCSRFCGESFFFSGEEEEEGED